MKSNYIDKVFNNKYSDFIKVFFAALVGIIAFLLIYGTTPINPTNDAWIMAGYDEYDICQHYCGWIAFRNSQWSFPLGLAKDMAIYDGTYISYTDSIPWVSILFKTIRNILPNTFQFFGIYILLCYILQGIAAFKIIDYKTNDFVYSIIGTILLVFSPIFMERSFRHTALGSQWLILFAIFLWLKHSRNCENVYIRFLILMVLAIGIHPYFLPMIGVFLLLSVIDDIVKKNYISIVLFFLILLITYIAGCVIGVLGTGIAVSRDGYGFYSMNLNALINPTSCGNYKWSSVFKVLPQILGNYDGFNYLGAGIFLGIMIVALLFLKYGNKVSIKRNIIAIILFAMCTLFAVSNVVTFNDRILLEIELPSKIFEICGIFRASSRIFYPVYYIIVISVILLLWKYKDNISRKKVCFILCLLCFVQIFDIHHCIIEKHKKMVDNSTWVSILDDEAINDIFYNGDNVILESCSLDRRYLSIAALKNGCKLYYSVANSGNYDNTKEEALTRLDQIKSNGRLGSDIIITSKEDILNQYLMYENIGYYEKYDCYFICDLENSKYVIHQDVSDIFAAELTDDEYTNGISNTDKTKLVFCNNKYNNEMLKNAKTITCNDAIFEITGIDSDDEWIYISVDKDASECGYPQALVVGVD